MILSMEMRAPTLSTEGVVPTRFMELMETISFMAVLKTINCTATEATTTCWVALGQITFSGDREMTLFKETLPATKWKMGPVLTH
ncbi:MAG: hypothetical protein BGO23_13105 [Solirubrobacterales bacterium 67-14]|nr:MAG: hypothetical protein BGO23_13105 [Solirubrobacterales bacterium 67-14]